MAWRQEAPIPTWSSRPWPTPSGPNLHPATTTHHRTRALAAPRSRCTAARSETAGTHQPISVGKLWHREGDPRKFHEHSPRLSGTHRRRVQPGLAQHAHEDPGRLLRLGYRLLHRTPTVWLCSTNPTAVKPPKVWPVTCVRGRLPRTSGSSLARTATAAPNDQLRVQPRPTLCAGVLACAVICNTHSGDRHGYRTPPPRDDQRLNSQSSHSRRHRRTNHRDLPTQHPALNVL
jgi:hypothetical protein